MSSIAKQARLVELREKQASLELRIERLKGSAEALGNSGRMERYAVARAAQRELADELTNVKAQIARLETPTIVMGRGPGNFPKRKYSERVPR